MLCPEVQLLLLLQALSKLHQFLMHGRQSLSPTKRYLLKTKFGFLRSMYSHGSSLFFLAQLIDKLLMRSLFCHPIVPCITPRGILVRFSLMDFHLSFTLRVVLLILDQLQPVHHFR